MLANRLAPAGVNPSAGVAAETKESRQARDLDDAVKSLRLEFRQQLAQHVQTAAIERNFSVRHRFHPRRDGRRAGRSGRARR